MLWSVLATAVLSAVLLGDGLGLNLLIVAVPAALAAFFAARSAGRRLRPWTATWAVGGLALLAVPALRDAGWPTFLAVVSAFALGSLTLHGSRTWPGVLVGSVGLFDSLVPGVIWGVRGIRARADGSRARWGAALRTAIVALVLLVVFGTLFASADAAFADLLGSLLPDARSARRRGGSSCSHSVWPERSPPRTPPRPRCAGTGSPYGRAGPGGGSNGPFH